MYFIGIKAFTQDKSQGNSAGICWHEGLSEQDQCQFAQNSGYPVSAFIRPRTQKSQWDIRFFTPKGESSLCVHALLGAAQVIFERTGQVPTMFHGINYPFNISLKDSTWYIQLPDPVWGQGITAAALRQQLADALHSPLPEGALPLQVVGTGKPKLLVPLPSKSALMALQPDPHKLLTLCQKIGAEGLFAFTAPQQQACWARHWNPLTLSAEDPICGNASGALLAYLEHFGGYTESQLTVHMGESCQQVGTVNVRHTSAGIEVGGKAVLCPSTTLE